MGSARLEHEHPVVHDLEHHAHRRHLPRRVHPDVRVRRRLDGAVPADRLSVRVLPGETRRPGEGVVPRAVLRAVLVLVHAADARLDRAAAGPGVRQPAPGERGADRRSVPVPVGPFLDAGPRSGLRVRAVHGAAPVRGAGPDPERAPGGRARPRGEPGADVLPRHAAADLAGDPGRTDHRRAADVRRLLHPAAAGEHGRHEDDRELHRGLARRADLRQPGSVADPGADGGPGRPDRLLPVEHGAGGAREGGMSATSATAAGPARVRKRRLRGLATNPWARPRFLWVFAIAYVLWMLVPVGTAALFSFNSTRSISIWSSFSLRWYITDPNESVLHDPDLRHAVLQ